MSLSLKQLSNNQIVVKQGGNEYFFSYETLVAKKTPKGRYIYKKYYKYSPTTSKYTAKFFDVDVKKMNEWVKSGRIKLI
jgi:hypothetical protein